MRPGKLTRLPVRAQNLPVVFVRLQSGRFGSELRAAPKPSRWLNSLMPTRRTPSSAGCDHQCSHNGERGDR